MTGVWVFTQQIVQNRYNIRHITLTTPVYFLPSNLPRLCGHAITLCKGKVLTWPHSLIFALATCLIATFNPSLLLIPAYTIPKPPFPRTGPTQINIIISWNLKVMFRHEPCITFQTPLRRSWLASCQCPCWYVCIDLAPASVGCNPHPCTGW